MEEATLIIVFLLFVVPIGLWVYNHFVSEPQKNIKIALYKFDTFKSALSGYDISDRPVNGSENILTYREKITNGVEVIGCFDYSIHDFIQLTETKKHNYYFSVRIEFKDLVINEKSSGYFKTYTSELCRNEISVLRKRITNNKNFKDKTKLFQIKDDNVKANEQSVTKNPNISNLQTTKHQPSNENKTIPIEVLNNDFENFVAKLTINQKSAILSLLSFIGLSDGGWNTEELLMLNNILPQLRIDSDKMEIPPLQDYNYIINTLRSLNSHQLEILLGIVIAFARSDGAVNVEELATMKNVFDAIGFDITKHLGDILSN